MEVSQRSVGVRMLLFRAFQPGRIDREYISLALKVASMYVSKQEEPRSCAALHRLPKRLGFQKHQRDSELAA